MTLDLNIQKLLAYEFWANRETIESLQRAGDAAPPRALQVMAHILAASRLWLTRMTMEQITVEVWPTLAIAQLPRELDALEAAWQHWLQSPIPAGLDDAVAYVNSKGEPWSSTAREILTHVVLHGSYHRGQIATLLGQKGSRAAYTDYIHAMRQQLL